MQLRFDGEEEQQAEEEEMGWLRKSESAVMDRLISRRRGEWSEKRIPKGYVPMLVGGADEARGGGEEEERVLVHVELLKDPRFAAFMEMAAGEFGYKQEGVLRLPCDARYFRRTVDLIISSKKSR